MKKVLLINGPNINMLGKREKGIYGNVTYEELNNMLQAEAEENKIELEIFQSNHEGEIVDRIQDTPNKFQLIIINAGAFTHTSIAIRDALLAADVPFIEVHISNIYKREEFRQFSYLSDIAEGVIAGFGINSYLLSLKAAAELLTDDNESTGR